MPERIGTPSTGIINLLFAIAILVGIAFMMSYIPHASDEQRPICTNLTPNIHSDVPIYSTQDGSAVSGAFFLGIGRVDTYPAYYFYTGDDVNGYQKQILNTAYYNVDVYQDSGYPHMIKKTKYKMVKQSGIIDICTPVEIIELHVPKNTLIKDIGIA
jgi:hypothetical protein